METELQEEMNWWGGRYGFCDKENCDIRVYYFILILFGICVNWFGRITMEDISLDFGGLISDILAYHTQNTSDTFQ